jgi:hypothetical protein
MKKVVLFLSILSFAFAMASDHEKGKKGHNCDKNCKHGHYFEHKDANDDGKISSDEWMNHSKEKFAKLDANKDGFVTEKEMKAHKKHRKGSGHEHDGSSHEHKGKAHDHKH